MSAVGLLAGMDARRSFIQSAIPLNPPKRKNVTAATTRTINRSIRFGLDAAVSRVEPVLPSVLPTVPAAVRSDVQGLALAEDALPVVVFATRAAGFGAVLLRDGLAWDWAARDGAVGAARGGSSR